MNQHTGGQAVYITGGASGIGLGLAKAYVQRGAAYVVLLDLKGALDAKQSLEAEKLSPTQQIGAYDVDVTDLESVRAAFAQGATDYAPATLVINSAGILTNSLFEDTDPKLFEKIIQVNLFGSRNVADAAFPYLKQTGGRLALVASLAGFAPNIAYSAYSTSKFAVRGLAEVLRLEFKSHGVQVSLIAPPEVQTPMVASERKQISQTALKMKMAAGSITVEQAIAAFIKGLDNGQYLIIPTFKARFFAWFPGAFPAVYRFVTDKMYKYYSKKFGE